VKMEMMQKMLQGDRSGISWYDRNIITQARIETKQKRIA
jgi:hypothetical protein